MRLEYFEMIDRVDHLDRTARRISATAIVPDESTVFEGHFPGHPLVPGVLLTETMAQASGFLLLALADFKRMPFLVGVDKARFRRFVPPGARLVIDAEEAHDGSGYAVTRAKIATDGKAICDAELRFRSMPFPETLEEKIRERARSIGMALETV